PPHDRRLVGHGLPFDPTLQLEDPADGGNTQASVAFEMNNISQELEISLEIDSAVPGDACWLDQAGALPVAQSLRMNLQFIGDISNGIRSLVPHITQCSSTPSPAG